MQKRSFIDQFSKLQKVLNFGILGILFISSSVKIYSQCCSNDANLLANYNPAFTIGGNPVPPGFLNDNAYSTNLGPGLYSVIVSRNWGACFLTPQFDHTTGDEEGRHLWFDTPFSATASTPSVAWKPYDPTRPQGLENLLDVIPNTTYVFSVWIRDLARNEDCLTGGPPIMGLRINGVDMAEINLGDYTSPCCPEWIYLCSEWSSGDTTLVEIKIESRSNDGFTDLGIDDVYFGTTFANNEDLLGNDISACSLENVILDPGLENATYGWNDGSAADTLLVTEPGLYWVDIIQNGCTGRDSILIIIENEVPQLNLGLDTVVCENDLLFLSPSLAPNGNYLWQNGATSESIEINEAGLYWLQVNGPCGIVSDTINVEFSPLPSISLGPDLAICNGVNLSVFADAQNASTFLWNNNSTADSIVINVPGTYFVNTFNDCGSEADTIVISLAAAPLVMAWNVSSQLEVCNKSLLVDATFEGSGAVALQWDNGTGTTGFSNAFSFTYIGNGDYTLELLATGNCGEQETLTQDFSLSSDFKEYRLAMPNIFSPNDDGDNDDFGPFPMLTEEEITMPFSLKIYNRWGILIYNGTKSTLSWNGQYNGNKCSEGIYFYIAEYFHPCNASGKKEEGSLTLIR